MNYDVYKYLIIKSLKLIVQFHQNNLSYEGLKKLKLSIINDPEYDPCFNFLLDLRLADTKMTPQELNNYGNWVEAVLYDKPKQMALLTSNPHQVSRAFIFKLNENFKNLSYEVFSTMEGALNHVGVDVSNAQFVENEIDKLKVKS